MQILSCLGRMTTLLLGTTTVASFLRHTCIASTRNRGLTANNNRAQFICYVLPNRKSTLRYQSSSSADTTTTTPIDSLFPEPTDGTDSGNTDRATTTTIRNAAIPPPWNAASVPQRVATKRRNNNARFRQHVNPLASSYQRPTLLPPAWPHSVFYTECTKDEADNTSRLRPLHLDIGCGKGGFLMDLCRLQNRRQNQQTTEPNDSTKEADHGPSMKTSSSEDVPPNNYLGLEIRPGVALYAQDRIDRQAAEFRGRVHFLGCNANVDLERILSLYQQAYTDDGQKKYPMATTTSLNDVDNYPCADPPAESVAICPPPPPQSLCLRAVTIQFPDPHFKTQHAKRRVATPSLIDTLAKYMPPAADASTDTARSLVFLQSDIQGAFVGVES